MRYFLDTEFNGFAGELISVALVPEHGDQEFYAVLPLPEAPNNWVTRNVLALSQIGAARDRHPDDVAHRGRDRGRRLPRAATARR